MQTRRSAGFFNGSRESSFINGLQQSAPLLQRRSAMAEDRELLELAARAAGYVVVGLVDQMIAQPGHKAGGLVIRNERGGDSAWHPGNDSGDALELLVRCGLKLNICVGGECVQVGGIGTYVEIDFDNDPLAATRRAIVRAAAEIGRKSNG
jgi:hypothetical protein